MGIEMYQCSVQAPTAIVDYSNIVMSSYPPSYVRSEPFVGFKLLMFDGTGNNAAYRLQQLDAICGQLLTGTGCFLREVDKREYNNTNAAIWVVTFPVPRSQVHRQVEAMMHVISQLCAVGFNPTGCIEIAVSGRCLIGETETAVANLIIPHRYREYLQTPNNSPYKFGWIIRINEEYICYRTSWNFKRFTQQIIMDDVIMLSQLISTVCH